MKKVLSVILMLAMVLVMFAGCGKAKKNNNAAPKKDPVSTQSNKDDAEDVTANKPKDEPEESKAGEDKVDKNNPFMQKFLPLESHKDVLDTFKEFGFVYNTKPEGKEATSWSFQWVSLGTEKIDGVDTEHMKITQVERGETKEFEAWYNAEWDAVKYKDSNGEKTGMDASFSGAGLGMFTQVYVNSKALAKMVFDEEGNVDDFMYNMKGKRSAGESVDLGNGPINIDLYDIEDKITHFDRLFGLSKVNGALMYTVIESINKDKDAMEGLRITRAVPR